MNDPPSRADLEQLLRDERALRMRAEARASEQTAKADTWRTRAEERSARIETIKAGAGRRTWPWRRRRPQPVVQAKPRASAEKKLGPARVAAVRVTTALDDSHESLVSAFATQPLVSGPAALAEADLVIGDVASLTTLPPEVQTRFAEWLDTPARQPLILISSDGDRIDDALARRAAAVLASGDAIPDGTRTGTVDPVFDPAIDNPIGSTTPRPGTVDRLDHDGVTSVRDGDTLVGIEQFDGTLHHRPWVIEAMARGVPTTPDRLDFSDPTAVSRAAAAARRWAYRNHTPTQRASQLLALAGVSARNPSPTVAAILVSMRPDEAARAITMLATQTHRPFSVVVGMHGVSATPMLRDAVGRLPADIPVTSLEIPGDLTLGEALNRAIAASSAEILAKIDDDDYYGPSHIEDGVHALEYSAVGIVGKGAQFTYVEEPDVTVLRRKREEETLLGGSPTGATMMFRRAVWERVGFPHRPRQVDVLFTAAARRNGVAVYGNSRWEFCYVRKSAGHTWTADPTTFLTGSDTAWTGFQPERTVVPSLPDSHWNA